MTGVSDPAIPVFSSNYVSTQVLQVNILTNIDCQAKLSEEFDDSILCAGGKGNGTNKVEEYILDCGHCFCSGR